jgi:hypothetical protein
VSLKELYADNGADGDNVRVEQRARKQIRGVRAEIHEAMLVAAAMARSKKKGTSKIEGNMETLGWERIGDNGRGLPVEQKYARR